MNHLSEKQLVLVLHLWRKIKKDMNINMNIVIYLLLDLAPLVYQAPIQLQSGAKVILAEDKPRFGGSLLTDDVTIDNLSGKDWADKIITELKEMPNVIVKNRSQVFGYYDHNMMVMFERTGDHLNDKYKYTPRQRLWYVRAKEVLLSTGSIERPTSLLK